MEYFLALVPSIGMGILFYVAIRAVFNADRNERRAVARLEAQQAAQDSVAAEDVGNNASVDNAGSRDNGRLNN